MTSWQFYKETLLVWVLIAVIIAGMVVAELVFEWIMRRSI